MYWGPGYSREACNESPSLTHQAVGGQTFPFTMYLNLIQLAESLGVSEKVIEGWIRDEGLPHTTVRSAVLFDRAQVAQWAATRGLVAKAGFLAPETSAQTSILQLGPLLRDGGIWRDVAAAEATEVIVRVATSLRGATPAIRQLLGLRLRAQGGVTCAPVGGGFALPHPSSRITLGRDSGAVALILLREGWSMPEPRVDDIPVTRLLFFIAPSPRAHLDMIGRLSRLLSHGALQELLAKGGSDEEIFHLADADDMATSSARKQGGKGP